MFRRRLILFTFAACCHGQAVYAQRYVDVPPVKSSPHAGLLGDVDSRVPRGYPSYYDADPVTFAHESTHGVNARLRNEHRAACGLYLLGGRGFVCPSPPVSLADVAAAVPVAHRGRAYRLYCVDAQAWWNDSPLYVLDECTAYVAGSLAGLELGLEARTLYSLDRAAETWGYSRVAAELARERGYPHADALDAVLAEIHREGIDHVRTEARRRGWR